MARTTSPQTPRKKPTSKLLWLALTGVWGCAPDPELVYVDLAQVEPASAPEVENRIVFDTENYALVSEIPEMEGQSVYIGSAQERAEEALVLFREAQEQAAVAILERLKKAYLAEAALFETSEEAVLDTAYRTWLEEELEAIRTIFVAHAEQVEPLRYRLTRLVGFPDPDPQSARVPLATNERARRNFEAAKALREQIQALVAEFRAEVERRLDAIEARRAERMAWIESRGEVLRGEAIRKAEAEADAVAQTSLAELERTALDPEAVLRAVPGAKSSVQSGSARVPPLPDSEGPHETEEDIKTQLDVFLKVHGYRRSTTPSKGRDATKEFLDWRRKYMVGR
jgi:hypothetical protein